MAWFQTVLGAYSIVKKGAPGEYQVRAREKQDLVNILKAINMPDQKIWTTHDSDYSFRIKVDKATVSKIVLAIADGIDYSNFKSEVARHPDQAKKIGPYHEIWSILSRLQPTRPYARLGSQSHFPYSSASGYSAMDDVERPLDDALIPRHAYVDREERRTTHLTPHAELFREWAASDSPLRFEDWCANRVAREKADRLLGPDKKGRVPSQSVKDAFVKAVAHHPNDKKYRSLLADVGAMEADIQAVEEETERLERELKRNGPKGKATTEDVIGRKAK